MGDMSTAFLPRTISLGLTPRDRRAVERQIEELIDLLDHLDGDADLEEDDFPGDEADWEMDAPSGTMLPRYGLDQSEGPVNIRESLAAADARWRAAR